ncbi:MAG: hypothetical protein JWP45_391 [Mucilaginibacter sp.]|nr:hypothetical protein [Mucilaginibacter sp.]
MKVGLFIPCYVDQFYPGAAVVILRLLKNFVPVVYPPNKLAMVSLCEFSF